MKKLKHIITGAAITAAVVGLGFSLKSKENIETSKKQLAISEKRIVTDNPQETLNEAFRIANPQNLSEVIYDPEFIQSDTYLRKQLQGQVPEELIESHIQNTRSQSKNHNLCVAGVILYTGNGEKRPTFARRELLTSPSIYTLEDLASAIEHEDVHAEEERKGYEFKNHRKKGTELAILFNKEMMRPAVISAIGEIDAYAAQIEKAETAEKKPSAMCLFSATTQLYKVSGIIEKALKENKITNLEREYAELKIGKHKKTIQKLKNLASLPNK